MTPTTTGTDLTTLRQTFSALAEQWKADVAVVSSTTAMTTHPAYRTVIALGPAVLPLLLRDLEQESAHWFEALAAISGEDPVPPAHWGDIAAMRADWLAWGRQRGLI